MSLSINTPVLERGLYEVLRLRLVKDGLTPDITSFEGQPNPYRLYREALKNISEEKGFAIELFGMSAPFSKGREEYPRIALSFNSLLPGTHGSIPNTFLVQEEGNYKEVSTGNLVYDYYFDVNILSTEVAPLRAATNAVVTTIPFMGTLNVSGENSFQCITILEGAIPLKREEDGVNGQVYTYKIPDVLLLDTQEYGTIPEINTIKVDMLLEYLGITSCIM